MFQMLGKSCRSGSTSRCRFTPERQCVVVVWLAQGWVHRWRDGGFVSFDPKYFAGAAVTTIGRPLMVSASERGRLQFWPWDQVRVNSKGK